MSAHDEVREMLCRIDERTLHIATELNVINGKLEKQDEKLEHHDKKIRSLEDWRNYIAGGGTVVAGLLAWIRHK